VILFFLLNLFRIRFFLINLYRRCFIDMDNFQVPSCFQHILRVIVTTQEA
jgi:hypothetical protein